MLVMICFSLSIGLCGGVMIVGIIWLRRRHQIVDSLVQSDRLVGLAGVVEIPFDCHSQGKVRININDSVLKLRAVTDEIAKFDLGDRIVVTATQGGRVWVVSEQAFRT